VEVTSESTANYHNSLLSVLKSHEDSEEDADKEPLVFTFVEAVSNFEVLLPCE
jgi:hypothetical protein